MSETVVPTIAVDPVEETGEEVGEETGVADQICNTSNRVELFLKDGAGKIPGTMLEKGSILEKKCRMYLIPRTHFKVYTF